MPVDFIEYGTAELIFAAFLVAATMYAVVLTIATVVALRLTREHQAESVPVYKAVETRQPVRQAHATQTALAG